MDNDLIGTVLIIVCGALLGLALGAYIAQVAR